MKYWKTITLFSIMGLVYYLIEILFDGDSHWTMAVLGGICGILIDQIDEQRPEWGYGRQILTGLAIVLPLEFITGCIVNLWLNLDIWDYSNLPLNLYGQTSLAFAPLFIPIIVLGMWLGNAYRYVANNEPIPKTRWW